MADPRPESLPTGARQRSERFRSWEDTYRESSFDDLPWFQRSPSAWIVRGRERGWLAKGGRHLDVGCGAGTNVLWMAQHGLRTTGVDLSPTALSAARNRARTRRGAREAGFLAGDAISLPFRDGSFDSGSDIGCFHTLPPGLRAGYASEVHRVLRPGGFHLISWAAREETRPVGPPHRLSVQEVAEVMEPHFVFRELEYGSHARGRRGLVIYSAVLEGRREPQPPPR